jgi:hypothetical protein
MPDSEPTRRSAAQPRMALKVDLSDSIAGPANRGNRRSSSLPCALGRD